MKSEKGQSIVEFALILPLLVLMLFGIIDFARIFHVYLTMDHAGREAGRAASIGKNDTYITQKAIDNGVSINLKATDVDISPKVTRKSGDNVTITITYSIDFLTPVIGNVVGPITLEDKTVMRVE